MFFVFVLIGLLVVFSTSVPLPGAIPASERAALIALYNETNGDNWYNSSGWKGNNNESDGFSQIGSEGNWYGISVSGNHVTDILLEDNNLTGHIPAELGNLGNLEYLRLSFNQLSGSIPPELGNLSDLYSLDLFSNQLSGSIPPELGNLSNLYSLNLFYNQLSGSIPPELGNLSNLYSLNLFYNQLSGRIPPELGNLSNLLFLYLNDNQLSGSIPPELGNLSNLSTLFLSSNQLSGSIPPWLGNLSDLYILDLSSNQLSGSIPPELGNLSNLDYLSLSSNQLSGSIPPELGNLSDLNYLDLSSNHLTGNIPTSLTNLTNLGYLNISHNCLYTDDPDLRAWLNSLDPGWESYQCLGEKDPPFGSFDTPIDGSTVCSSIPVTGWALDDSGIDSVKIYRAQGKSLIYIGDAVLVEGARPDVAEAYPGYPNNTRAGWGYMMLTNFLPNSGNGTFVIHAIATDLVGKTTTLGTKTIHCDNANAVKPFGAIDTPTQGGTATGSSFINWGWVLTPQPNSIPTDGSTINVYVDGVNIGSPIYNIYRSDIASLFPGYNNIDGAAGYFYLDTTAYENGVHTIQWTASDDAGNSDGIGSRYFTIQNTGRAAGRRAQSTRRKAVAFKAQDSTFNFNVVLCQIPVDSFTPVWVRIGYNKDIEAKEIYPDVNDIVAIEINELERLEIHFFEREIQELANIDISTLNVEQRILNTSSLPIGATLDTQRGVFYWQPGPGFLGQYQLVFVERGPNGEMNRKNININIVSRK